MRFNVSKQLPSISPSPFAFCARYVWAALSEAARAPLRVDRRTVVVVLVLATTGCLLLLLLLLLVVLFDDGVGGGACDDDDGATEDEVD